MAELTLQKELDKFHELLPTLTNEEGRFVLIAGNKLLGMFDTYGDAIEAGYKERGLKPFLVKQIATVELVANFTRHVVPSSCRTSVSR